MCRDHATPQTTIQSQCISSERTAHPPTMSHDHQSNQRMVILVKYNQRDKVQSATSKQTNKLGNKCVCVCVCVCVWCVSCGVCVCVCVRVCVCVCVCVSRATLHRSALYESIIDHATTRSTVASDPTRRVHTPATAWRPPPSLTRVRSWSVTSNDTRADSPARRNTCKRESTSTEKDTLEI
jgi:hypothetical protein